MHTNLRFILICWQKGDDNITIMQAADDTCTYFVIFNLGLFWICVPRLNPGIKLARLLPSSFVFMGDFA